MGEVQRVSGVDGAARRARARRWKEPVSQTAQAGWKEGGLAGGRAGRQARGRFQALTLSELRMNTHVFDASCTPAPELTKSSGVATAFDHSASSPSVVSGAW